MIKATRNVIRQISSQEINPRTVAQVYFDRVATYEKVILGLALANVILVICNSLYYFAAMDHFFDVKYDKVY